MLKIVLSWGENRVACVACFLLTDCTFCLRIRIVNFATEKVVILKHEDLQVSECYDWRKLFWGNYFGSCNVKTLLVEGVKNVRKQLILEQNCSILHHNGGCSHVSSVLQLQMGRIVAFVDYRLDRCRLDSSSFGIFGKFLEECPFLHRHRISFAIHARLTHLGVQSLFCTSRYSCPCVQHSRRHGVHRGPRCRLERCFHLWLTCNLSGSFSGFSTPRRFPWSDQQDLVYPGCRIFLSLWRRSPPHLPPPSNSLASPPSRLGAPTSGSLFVVFSCSGTTVFAAFSAGTYVFFVFLVGVVRLPPPPLHLVISSSSSQLPCDFLVFFSRDLFSSLLR